MSAFNKNCCPLSARICTTSVDVGSCLEKLLKEGLFNKDLFENMIQQEYDDFDQTWIHDDFYYDSDLFWRDIEIWENDKRVMEQYDPDYYAFLEWIRYQKSLGVPGLDTDDQIERLWKLHKIRKLMKGK